MALTQLLDRVRLSERAKIQTKNLEADAPSVPVNRIAGFREVLDRERQSVQSRLGRKRSVDSRDPR